MFREKCATRIDSRPDYDPVQDVHFSSLRMFGRKDNTFDQLPVCWRPFRV